MKISHLVIMTSFIIISSMEFASAELPPKYLSVLLWNKCVRTQIQGGAEFYCIPPVKPEGCPQSSWDEILALEELEDCLPEE